MKNKVFLLVGFILFAVGILVYYMIGQDSTKLIIQNRVVNNDGLKHILALSIGGGIAALGGLFLLSGLIGQFRSAKLNKEKLQIMKTGIKTEGKITFVDKNYTLLINNNPVFSIVEYSYSDKSGNVYTRRIDTISSNLVIRNQIQVGSIVSVKYKSDDPSKSVMLLNEAAKQATVMERCEFCGSKYSLQQSDVCPKCGS